MHALTGHGKSVTGAIFLTDDGSILLTYSADTTLRLWHTGTGKSLLQVTGRHKASVRCGAMLSDRVSVATGDADGRVFIHSVYTGIRGVGGVVVGGADAAAAVAAVGGSAKKVLAGAQDAAQEASKACVVL